MYGVHMLLVPLGNKRARLESHHVTGSDYIYTGINMHKVKAMPLHADTVVSS